jgi:threonine/homoserine/homoserine lactone efflux protein
MGEAVGQVLSLGVGVALSPIPIIGVVLMLATPRGRTNGAAFIAGWIAGLSVAGAIVLLVAGGLEPRTEGHPADWVNALKALLGLALLLIAVKQWRDRPRAGDEPRMPTWMRAIDRFTAGRAAALGVALSAINPKNLLLVVGAAAAIAQTEASTGRQVGALAIFVFIGTLGPATPVAIHLAMGERSRRFLDELRDWMSRHNHAIMAVVCLVIAAKLIGDAITGFAA